MALLAKDAAASGDASTMIYAQAISGLIAGEDIAACAPCYIKTDGLVYMSDGTAANEAAKISGWNLRPDVKAGQPVTLFPRNVRMRYGTGLTPGARYFLGTTPGRLDTAATTGDAVGIAEAINSTDIRSTRDS